MRRSRLMPVLATIVLMALLMLTVTACNDDDGPTCPAGTVTPTMANLWPHADGSNWTYDLVQTSYEDTTATLSPVGTTTLPSLDQLYAELNRPLVSASLDTFTAGYSLALDGDVVTQSGVTAQQLVESLLRDDGTPVAVTGGQDALLTALARARPELRASLPPRARVAADGFGHVSSPLLLGGYAFAYEDSGYFGYGDLSTQHSWIYLADSVEVGTEFALRLVPQLANDIWLRGRVRTHRAVMVAGQRRCNAVEVQYVIDFGESNVVDENALVLGAYRSYLTGLIVYVPEIGPVYSHERMNSQFSTAYQPNGELFYHADQILTLTGVTLPD